VLVFPCPTDVVGSVCPHRTKNCVCSCYGGHFPIDTVNSASNLLSAASRTLPSLAASCFAHCTHEWHNGKASLVFADSTLGKSGRDRLLATAIISWLFVSPLQIREHVDNLYVGIVVFVFLGAIFFAGLVLIPIGVYLSKLQISKGLGEQSFDRKAALRRIAWRWTKRLPKS